MHAWWSRLGICPVDVWGAGGRYPSDKCGRIVYKRLENTHGLEFRDLLYRFHPWSGFRIAVHAAIYRRGGLVFRCDVADSDLERRIPEWMLIGWQRQGSSGG
jgi:hypothetical protein